MELNELLASCNALLAQPAQPAPAPALDILATAKPKKAKATSDTPDVSLPEYAKRLERRRELARQMSDAKAEIELIDADLKAVADAKRIEISVALGKRCPSIRINDSATAVFALNHMKDYSESMDEIERVFGPLTGQYFRRQYTVDGDISKSPEVLAALAAAGFELSYTVKATPQLEVDRTLRADVRNCCEQAGIKPIFQVK